MLCAFEKMLRKWMGSNKLQPPPRAHTDKQTKIAPDAEHRAVVRENIHETTSTFMCTQYNIKESFEVCEHAVNAATDADASFILYCAHSRLHEKVLMNFF